MHRPDSRLQALEQLRRRLREVERSRRRRLQGVCARPEIVPTGLDGFDNLLPAGGIRAGTLVEWLAAGDGTGAGTLALTVASRLLRGRAALVVIDEPRRFHPPAAVRMGLELCDMIVVHPQGTNDTLWALEESLGCRGVAAVMCWIDRLDSVSFRRLQLAAEAGGGTGLLLRPAQIRRHPSWADVRLLVQPVPVVNSSAESLGRRLRITMLSCRGGQSGGNLVVDIDDEGSVRKVPQLVSPADRQRTSGA